MDSNLLFTSSLGLQAPWQVKDIRFEKEQGQIHLRRAPVVKPGHALPYRNPLFTKTPKMKLNRPLSLTILLPPLLLCLSNVQAANIQVGDDTSMIVPIADKTLKAQLFQATRRMNND